ncbi:MAG: ROK family protein [Verrucomicrobiae bacterium]|nr:ROK family protein [Verrucomicrobiae bacterium]
MNPLLGTINNPYTLPGWEDWNIVDSLSKELALPVWLENDADVAGLGEYHYGAAQGASRMVMLTVGTGVGGAVILNGGIYRGSGGEHPELGHMHVANDGPPCYCGRNGCLESFISGTAIAAAGKAYGFADASSVFAAAPESSEARSILAAAGTAIEAATWTLLHAFLPDRIVLGGGLAESQMEFFLNNAKTSLNRAKLFEQDRVTITGAQLGNLAGLIGAAYLALNGIGREAMPVASHNPAVRPN